MTSRLTPQISSRKKPQQARSADLMAAILTAAVQVLAKEGLNRFTTARVAERAGVSVGSLYQYFPNKAAILFRLQSDEWRQTSEKMREILDGRQIPPLKRLRLLVHCFLRSECEEAEVRVALNDAAPFYRDAPEAEEAKESVNQTMDNFLREVLGQAPEKTRAAAGNLILTVLSSAGHNFSAAPKNAEEIETYGEALADMFCAYLEGLKSRPNPQHSGLAASDS